MTFTAVTLADLRNRIAAAVDTLNRVADTLASCVPKHGPNTPLTEIVIDLSETQRTQMLGAIDRAINTAQAVQTVLGRRA